MPNLYRTSSSGHRLGFQDSALVRPTSRREPILTLAALHRVLTPQLLRRAYPWLYPYDKKAKRDLDSLAQPLVGELKKYQSQYKFHPDVYLITEAGYEKCVEYPGIDLGTIPLGYQQPKGAQILHELSISELAIARYEFVRECPTAQILEEGRFSLLPRSLTESKSKDSNLGFNNVFDRLVPDYWYLKRDRQGLMFRCEEHFVGEASTTRIKEKLLEYALWARREDVRQFLLHLYRMHGAKRPQPAFEVHCVLQSRSFQCTDDDKLRATLAQTLLVPADMQGRIWTTTRQHLDEAVDTIDGFNTPVWYRGKDLMSLRGDFESVSGRERVRMISEWMSDAPKYSQFS